MQQTVDPPETPRPIHLTLGQAAKSLGVHKSTLSKAIDTGKLSACKQGYAYQIDPAELTRYRDSVLRKKSATVGETAKTDSREPQKSATSTEDRHQLEKEILELKGELKAAQGLADERAERIASLEKNITEEREEWRQFRLMITHQQEAKKGFFARLFG